jgi:hypothetical protein
MFLKAMSEAWGLLGGGVRHPAERKEVPRRLIAKRRSRFATGSVRISEDWVFNKPVIEM